MFLQVKCNRWVFKKFLFEKIVCLVNKLLFFKKCAQENVRSVKKRQFFQNLFVKYARSVNKITKSFMHNQGRPNDLKSFDFFSFFLKNYNCFISLNDLFLLFIVRFFERHSFSQKISFILKISFVEKKTMPISRYSEIKKSAHLLKQKGLKQLHVCVILSFKVRLINFYDVRSEQPR